MIENLKKYCPLHEMSGYTECANNCAWRDPTTNKCAALLIASAIWWLSQAGTGGAKHGGD